MKNQMNIVFTLAVIILLINSLAAGCTKTEQIAASPPETPGENVIDEEVHQVTTVSEPVEEPYNPDGEPETAFKSLMIRSIIKKASVFYWELMVGGDGPENYESLLEEGILPIIFTNRYTGADIRNTSRYSPGDIYLHFPTKDNPVFSFWDHYGEKDYAYDPSLALQGEKHPLQGMDEYTTDGRTLYLDVEVSPEEMALTSSASGCRERYGIPPDDEARARVLLVFDAMDKIMRSAGSWIDDVPSSLDGYLELVGRRNPVAWTNPYTGEPMHEVPWANVPQCQHTGSPFNEPIPELGNNKNLSSLAGNYSFAIGPERDYAQFYFKQPDGSIGAYIVLAKRP